ncbi:MAG: VCBS repeat-containing protein [Azonexaceae bacterium]|nr:VCBS repeat-containing protein [Azonexaceae bacterium]
MIIASSNLQMASSHASVQQHEVRESLKMWVGPQRPQFAGEESRPRPARTDNVSLSDAGKAASQACANEPSADSELDADPRLRFIRSMLELLTGQRIRIFDASELQPAAETPAIEAPPAPNAAPPRPASAGYGVEYDRHESYSEAEQTTFSANGTVTTADGRTIKFDVQLSMSRQYHEESDISLRLGDAARKTDPLVLNFAGTAAQLTDQRFAFDLNADGSAEKINFLAPGSGFLAFDRNGDGQINNGSELFGPTSGDGFQELTALDGDKNGWIDENDAAFTQLAIWTPDKIGKDALKSLSDTGVGAIALSRIATPFDLKTNANELLGQIRTSGIFLHESGTAGTIQQIDLTA